MEGLEDELTCPVCLELFTSPLQLPCYHNLCRRCAEVLLEQSETDPKEDDDEVSTCSAATSPGPEGAQDLDTFPCPTCREMVKLDTTGLVGLRKNFLLQNIVERYLRLKDADNTRPHRIPCQLCKEASPKMAEKSCLVCKASYCDQCLALTHPAFPPFSEHKLVSPRTCFDETVMCPDHPTKPVEMYCVQDQTPVCLLCEKVGRHKQHNMAALEEVFSQRRVELQANVDRLGARVAMEEEKVQGLENIRDKMMTSADKLKAQIDKQCESLVDVIRHRSAEMHRKLELTRQQDNEKIQKVIEHSTDAIQKAQAVKSYSLEVLKETDHASLLSADQSLKAKIEGTIDILDKSCDSNYDDITCAIDELNIDLTQKKKDLITIDFGTLPATPVITDEQCSSKMEEARIKWQPVAKAFEYDVGYSVGNVRTVATLKDCSYTATNLTPGTKYKFEVVSKNKVGRSCPSTIELSTTPFKFQLDPNTASRHLLISEENTHVRKLKTPIPLPKASLASSRFDPKGDNQHTVFGDKSIKRGRHYWEVSVEGEYSIGVAYADMPRDVDIRQTDGQSWALDYVASESHYNVMCGKVTRLQKHINPPLSKIGVLVDYDKRRFSVYNAITQAHICTIKTAFTEPLYPAFSLHSGSLKIHSVLECP